MTFEARSMYERVDCLGSSCMKWGADGELSPNDLQSILERLSAVDNQASGLMNCSIEHCDSPAYLALRVG